MQLCAYDVELFAPKEFDLDLITSPASPTRKYKLVINALPKFLSYSHKQIKYAGSVSRAFP